MAKCPCWVWTVAILTFLGVAASVVLAVYFTSNGSDMQKTIVGINNTNTNDIKSKNAIENNITSDTHNTIGVNVPVKNVIQPVIPIKNSVQPDVSINNTQNLIVKNNVSLTIVNNIRVFLDDAH